eukprot:858895-Rhodomonas_salina.1
MNELYSLILTHPAGEGDMQTKRTHGASECESGPGDEAWIWRESEARVEGGRAPARHSPHRRRRRHPRIQRPRALCPGQRRFSAIVCVPCRFDTESFMSLVILTPILHGPMCAMSFWH